AEAHEDHGLVGGDDFEELVLGGLEVAASASDGVLDGLDPGLDVAGGVGRIVEDRLEIGAGLADQVVAAAAEHGRPAGPAAESAAARTTAAAEAAAEGASAARAGVLEVLLLLVGEELGELGVDMLLQVGERLLLVIGELESADEERGEDRARCGRSKHAAA